MKSKKLAIGLGLVASFGLVMMPLAAYAIDPDSTNVTINVTVGDAISITTPDVSGNIASGIVSLDPILGTPASRTFNVNVLSNATAGTYALDINMSTGSTNNALNFNTTDSIPAVAGSPTTLTGSAWGYKFNTGTTWQAVPLSATPTRLVSSGSLPTGSGSGFDAHPITFGASVDGSEVPGTYTGVVTLTVSVN